jgi:hypothetical protein
LLLVAEMRNRSTSKQAASKKSGSPATKQAADKGAALAKARCTEIAMLAAARGWGKKRLSEN